MNKSLLPHADTISNVTEMSIKDSLFYCNVCKELLSACYFPDDKIRQQKGIVKANSRWYTRPTELTKEDSHDEKIASDALSTLSDSGDIGVSGSHADSCTIHELLQRML